MLALTFSRHFGVCSCNRYSLSFYLSALFVLLIQYTQILKANRRHKQADVYLNVFFQARRNLNVHRKVI